MRNQRERQQPSLAESRQEYKGSPLSAWPEALLDPQNVRESCKQIAQLIGEVI